MKTINYIIASYPGITNSRIDDIYSPICLDLQLKILSKILKNKKTMGIECLIKQITIIVTECDKNINIYDNYYKFEEWKLLFNEDIKLIFQEYIGNNNYFSYDKWIQAIVKNWDEFSHHIIIEDDYCIDPYLVDFDIKLLDIYNKKFPNNIGYLSQRSSNIHGYRYHACISNGIISSESMKKLKDPLALFYKYEDNCQLAFSFLFLDNDIKIENYGEYFRIPFWSSYFKKLIDFSFDPNIKQACFIPVQEIDISAIE